MRALLDTHILVFWVSDPHILSTVPRQVVETAGPTSPLFVSDISLWEVAALVSSNRLRLDRPLRDWLERAVAPPLVRRVGITPAVASEVAALPSTFHGDPADRIIVASARVMGAVLLTNDGTMRDAGTVETT